MKRFPTLALLCAAFTFAAPAMAQSGTGEPPLAPLAFMHGCWWGTVEGGGTIEEAWTAADADVMLATTRYVSGGRVTGWEFSRVHADSSGVWLTPYPDGERSVSFRLVRSEGEIAVFENREHDFPKRVVYRAPTPGALAIRVEDDESGIEFTLAANACGPPGPAASPR